jgi:hypothetical protein
MAIHISDDSNQLHSNAALPRATYLNVTGADTIFQGAVLVVPKGVDQVTYMRQMQALRNTYSEFQQSLSRQGEQEQLVSIVNRVRARQDFSPFPIIEGILEEGLGKGTPEHVKLQNQFIQIQELILTSAQNEIVASRLRLNRLSQNDSTTTPYSNASSTAIFADALTATPEGVLDASNYASKMTHLKEAYREFQRSCQGEDQEELLNIANATKGRVNPRLPVCETPLVIIASILKSGLREGAPEYTELKDQFIQIQESILTSAQRKKAETIVSTIIEELPVHGMLKELINRQPLILEKLAIALPELFKMTEEQDFLKSDNDTLFKFKKVMGLARDLPPAFKEAIRLDSSEKDFDTVSRYREQILRLIILASSPQKKSELIEQLREDMPKISG